MKILFQEDDCAPDALEYFEEKMQSLLHLSIKEFQNIAQAKSYDTGTDWSYEDKILRWCQEDPFYALFELEENDLLKAHINKLEEALKNSLRCGWHSMEGSLDGTFDDLTEQEIRQFRKDARNLIAKEVSN